MRLLIDMDGVTADLLAHWLDTLTQQTGIIRTKDDVKEWSVHKAYPELSPGQVYSLLDEPDFFRHLAPVPQAVSTLRRLMAKHEVVFLTACTKGHRAKLEWIAEHIPEFNLDNVVFAKRKELVQGDFLLDDYTLNLESWQSAWPGGVPVCFAAAYNTDWNGNYRVDNWLQFEELVEMTSEVKERLNVQLP